jgi:sterol 3beta-glucosyltransferase
MRIDILAIGSQGDVQPSVALGVGLQSAGHHVRIVTMGGFEALVRPYGLEHLQIGNAPKAIADTSAGRSWIERRASAIGFLRGFVRVAASMIESGIAAYWNACGNVDALIVTPMGLPVGMHIAERLGVPMIRAAFAPTRHDWAGRSNLAAALRGDLNASTAAVFRALLWSQLRGVTNKARRNVLELPPLPFKEPYGAMNRRRVPVLDAYSPSVVPAPPNCASWVYVTGYWFLDNAQAWTPPYELADFLESGPAPVFVGFGSTPFPKSDSATDLIVEAIRQAGRRGVIVAGGSGLRTGRLTDDVLSVESVPHSWLFPRVSAAVHHGGAGVTGAALRSGLPSVVVPIFGDQPFWGQRVFQLGAGPRPIAARELTAENLGNAIRFAARTDVRRRAGSLGEQIRRENGVARAIEVIQDRLARVPQARRAS